MKGFAPHPTTTSSADTSIFRVRRTEAAIASRSSGIPALGVYPVLPSIIARIPASRM